MTERIDFLTCPNSISCEVFEESSREIPIEAATRYAAGGPNWSPEVD